MVRQPATMLSLYARANGERCVTRMHQHQQQQPRRAFATDRVTTTNATTTVSIDNVSSLLSREETWSAERCAAHSSVQFGHAWRTHHCVDLANEALLGADVTLVGWVHHCRALGSMSFIVLRDSTGLVQITCSRDALSSAPTLESVVQVRGRVRARPSAQRNATMASGGIEIDAQRVDVINASRAPLPLPVGETVGEAPREEARLRHRYLDLRSVGMQQRMAMRARVLFAARSALVAADFTEIETPTLFRRTSEGAREFLVPTRQRGRFYALPQSPQQYKQMLVVGGIARYFQVARCYRDEATRADRQPEFTQVDRVALHLYHFDKIQQNSPRYMNIDITLSLFSHDSARH